MAKETTRAHIARKLEARYRPLFLLERAEIPWPINTDEDRVTLGRLAGELGAAFDAAGLKADRLSAHGTRWSIDGDAHRGIHAKTMNEQVAIMLRHAREELASGRWLALRNPTIMRYGVLGAIERASPAWREQLLLIAAREYRAQACLVIVGREVRLRPDPHDLRGCVQLLITELVAGGWRIRRCGAPDCGRYLGQWTKRERLFCDDRCRTAHHNSRRGGREAPLSVAEVAGASRRTAQTLRERHTGPHRRARA